MGCSLRRSWSQSDGRKDDSDPFQQELGPHPCPAKLNLNEKKEVILKDNQVAT